MDNFTERYMLSFGKKFDSNLTGMEDYNIRLNFLFREQKIAFEKLSQINEQIEICASRTLTPPSVSVDTESMISGFDKESQYNWKPWKADINIGSLEFKRARMSFEQAMIQILSHLPQGAPSLSFHISSGILSATLYATDLCNEIIFATENEWVISDRVNYITMLNLIPALREKPPLTKDIAIDLFAKIRPLFLFLGNRRIEIVRCGDTLSVMINFHGETLHITNTSEPRAVIEGRIEGMLLKLKSLLPND